MKKATKACESSTRSFSLSLSLSRDKVCSGAERGGQFGRELCSKSASKELLVSFQKLSSRQVALCVCVCVCVWLQEWIASFTRITGYECMMSFERHPLL